jgi:16S rRNA (cytosine967-C5)-methyltransferase
MSHPQFLIERWQNNLGHDLTEQLCAWNNAPPKIYARINRLKIEYEDFLRLYPRSVRLEDNRDFVRVDAIPVAALNRGDCYIQDPSTIISCRLLDPRPGENILDACAAPGGKTAYLAQLMKNRGRIIACDRGQERMTLLGENMTRLGVRIAHGLLCDWESDRIPAEIISAAPFDRILVDAPCSNTGVMQRRVDVRWRLRPSDFVQMPERQLKIVRSVLPLLKANGALVYSTCSLDREENDLVVRRILSDFSLLSLEQQDQLLPFRDGFDGAFAARFIRRS